MSLFDLFRKSVSRSTQKKSQEESPRKSQGVDLLARLEEGGLLVSAEELRTVQAAIGERIRFTKALPEQMLEDPRGAEMEAMADGYVVHVSYHSRAPLEDVHAMAATFATISELAKTKKASRYVLRTGKRIGFFDPWNEHPIRSLVLGPS